MTAIVGDTPLSCPPTTSANHLTNPTWLRPPARATRVANHASVFHADLLEMMSSHVTILSNSISEITTMAAVGASINSPPKNQTTRAVPTRIPSWISTWTVGPP